jgi:hypothetical protein
VGRVLEKQTKPRAFLPVAFLSVAFLSVASAGCSVVVVAPAGLGVRRAPSGFARAWQAAQAMVVEPQCPVRNPEHRFELAVWTRVGIVNNFGSIMRPSLVGNSKESGLGPERH